MDSPSSANAESASFQPFTRAERIQQLNDIDKVEKLKSIDLELWLMLNTRNFMNSFDPPVLPFKPFLLLIEMNLSPLRIPTCKDSTQLMSDFADKSTDWRRQISYQQRRRPKRRYFGVKMVKTNLI
jgi:hypothetical protein